MTKENPPVRTRPVFLILGVAFITIGASSENRAFLWIGLAFAIMAFVPMRASGPPT